MSPVTQTFSVRWSRLTWVVTLVVGLLVLLTAITLFWSARQSGAPGSTQRMALTMVAFIPFVVVAAVTLLAPRGFEVRSDAVVVKRLGKDVAIPLVGVREIRPVEAREVRFIWRLCGCGGFLGWFGLFYSRALGQFWAYAGSLEDLVLLTQTNGRKIVVSPHPRESFLEAVWETEAGRHLQPDRRPDS